MISMEKLLARVRAAQRFAEKRATTLSEKRAKSKSDDAALWSGKAIGLREAGDIIEAEMTLHKMSSYPEKDYVTADGTQGARRGVRAV